MRTFQLFFVFIFLFSLSLKAQNTDKKPSSKEPISYKLTFININQYQLKEMVPFCMEVFESAPINKAEEPLTLYFNSNVKVTDEILKDELLKNNVTHRFNLKIIKDEQ